MSIAKDSLCRLCASDKELNDDLLEDNLQSRQLILKYLSIKIKNEDNLSTKICSKCIDKIDRFHKYALQCERTQAMFETYKNETITDHIHLQNLKAEFNIGFDIKEELKYENENENFNEDTTDRYLHSPEKSKTIYGTFNGKTVQRKSSRLKRNHNLKMENIFDDADPDDEPLIKLLSVEFERMENMKNNVKMDHNVVSNIKFEYKSDSIDNWFTFTCHICKLECNSWSSLKLHVKRKHKTIAQVKCICCKTLSTRRSLWNHWYRHNPERRINKCDSCQKTFRTKRELKTHENVHLPKEELPYVCCKCAKRFANPRILKAHEKIHVPREQRFIWTCEICETKFATKGALGTHVKSIHQKLRPYMCHLCGHSFSSKANLKEHTLRHSSEKKFICDKCQKRFKTKGALVRHIDTHGDTAYQCPHCSMLLNSRRTLRNHLFVHDESGAHICPMCGKTFKRRKDIKNHLKLHTGERPYSCQWCTRTFSNGSNCRIHKRRMHPMEFQLAEGENPYAPTDETREMPTKVIHTTIKSHIVPWKSYNTEEYLNNTRISTENG